MIYSIIAILVISLCFGGSSSLVISLYGLVLGYSFCIICIPTNSRKEAIKIFNIVFTIYLTFTCLRCLDIYLYPQYFYKGIDEIHYWEESNTGANYSTTELLNELFSDFYIEERLYYFFIKYISSVATSYFDGNSKCLQLLGTSVVGSYISIFLFGILKHFNIAEASKKTLVYMTVVCILPVSLIIHRDSLVALFYAISLYYGLCCINRIRTIIIIIFCSFVTFFIREQSGLFLIAFLLLYIYNTSKYKKIILVLFGGILLAVMPYVMFVYNNLNDTIAYYTQYAEDNASGGLSRYIDILPDGLKHIALVIQGQFNPLPIWAKWPTYPTFYTMLIGVLWCIISVHWFMVFSFSVYFSIKHISLIPKKLLLWGGIFIIFLFLNCTNADPRRMVCMYPVCYLIYCYLVEFVLRLTEKRKLQYYYGMSVFAFMLVIIVLKF